ncbi:hypothetical protein HYZ70_03205 [Candidatus Curtissbacteria bacterium]|nr:hypothetical protein [Candidatus Curtissbacteria bacterium]
MQITRKDQYEKSKNRKAVTIVAEEFYSWQGYSPMALPNLKLGSDQTEENKKPQSEKREEQERNPPEN